MLRHQYEDLFEVRDAKWKNEEKNRDVSALFLFLPQKNIKVVIALHNVADPGSDWPDQGPTYEKNRIQNQTFEKSRTPGL